MTALLLLALTAPGQQAHTVSHTPEALVVRLQVDHWKHQMYDPLFVRVVVTNRTSETVHVGPRLCHRAGYMIIGEPFRYRFESEYVDGFNEPLLPMDPSDGWIVDYEILQVPPIKLYDHDFWSDIAGASAIVRTEVSSGIEAVDKLLSHNFASRKIHLAQRPKGETDFIRSLYAKLSKRRRENVPARGVEESVDVDRPAPGHFGLQDFGSYSDLVGELLAHEKDLSPGSLRDIVHLTQIMRTIYDETDEAKRLDALNDAIAWLESLPEIQRECFLRRILSWASNCAPAHRREDKVVYFKLANAVIRRLPKQAFYHKDYQAYRLREFSASHPGFAEYARAKPPDAD